MKTSRLDPDEFALLRHVEVHGPRTKVELYKGLQKSEKDVVKRMAYLLTLGYLALDETTKPVLFALTGRARLALADPHAVRPPAPTPPPKKPKEADSSAMSVAEAARTARRIPPKLHLNTPPARARVRQATLTAPYRATEYSPSPRAGANAAFTLPSRYGDELHYRDGRVTDMGGNPLP